MFTFSRPTRRHGVLLTVFAVAIVALTTGLTRIAHVGESVGGPPMSDASMRLCTSDWFSAHPAHGAVPAALAASGASDTFLVISFRFDTDGKAATQVDTAKIVAGQSVMWKLVSGFHTTTSGNPGDLTAGSVWDLPVDPSSAEQVVTFPVAGTFPFHCRPHGSFLDMRGVVVVAANTAGVAPGAVGSGVGFVGPAWPNPSRAGSSFRFRVDRAGDVRLRMLDASGRVVAHVLDASFAPGVHEAIWNARRADGSRMQAGTYWALLEIHGARSTTKVVLAR